MGESYSRVLASLSNVPRRWLVTGAAGFIGSNLVECLLDLGQTVCGLDNFATGHWRNLEEVRDTVGAGPWQRFRFVEGDIRDMRTCRQAAARCDYVLHQAALGSVPGSIEDPVTTNAVNVDGFVNLLVAARDAGVQRLVYASSCAVYGDLEALPHVEGRTGQPLSPYAASKLVDEIYAASFARAYGFGAIGLRYFNVFGPRQDPEGAYAAVIPAWIGALLRGAPVWINGDGETSRDFCHIDDVVQANLLAATAPEDAAGGIFNIATGTRTSLNELIRLIMAELAALGVATRHEPSHRAFRSGDLRHSQADIAAATDRLGFRPTHDIQSGLAAAMPWYRRTLVTS